MIEGKCEYCGEDKAIRNPTGKCDHLHYPENVNKNYSSENLTDKDLDKINSYLDFKGKCVDEGMFNIDEIIKLWESTRKI